MIKPPNHFMNNAFKILKVTASGGATVFLSTLTSCYFAVVIEKTAHRIQYRFFPQWYADVDFALGLDLGKETNRDKAKDKEESEIKTENQLNIIGDNSVSEIIDNGIGAMGSFDEEGNRIDTVTEEIGLHHSELHPYWQDDFDYSAQPKYGEDKFEIPSAYASTSNTNTTTTTGVGNYSTTSIAENRGSGNGDQVSTFSSLKELVIAQSKSSESMSSALQSCAMTA